MMDAQKYWDEYLTQMEPVLKEALAEAKEEDQPLLEQCLAGVKNEISGILTTTSEDQKKRHLVNLENYQAIMIDHKAILSVRFGNLMLQAVSTGLTIIAKSALGLIAI